MAMTISVRGWKPVVIERINAAASTVPPAAVHSDFERDAELGEREFRTLEPSPRAVVGAAGHDRTDESIGEPGGAFVLVEDVEGRREDHAAQIEDDRSIRHGGRGNQSASSAMICRASGCCAPMIIVVIPDSCHAPKRSAMRSFGPINAISSTNASGTAAMASAFLPSR